MCCSQNSGWGHCFRCYLLNSTPAVIETVDYLKHIYNFTRMLLALESQTVVAYAYSTPQGQLMDALRKDHSFSGD